jgi:hypothetical protein
LRGAVQVVWSEKMSRKKTKKPERKTKGVLMARTARDFLEDMPSYRTYSKFVRYSLIGCMSCIAASVLLRMNFEGFDEVALFLNVLAYVLVGVMLFTWMSHLRPMQKKARLAAQEFNSQNLATASGNQVAGDTADQAEGSTGGVESSQGDASSTALNPSRPSLFERLLTPPSSSSLPRSPEYLRYRLVWRVLLAVAAVLIIVASATLRVFGGPAGLALTIQIAALIPVAGAIYIYRAHLRPLKQDWRDKHPGKKG